MAVPDEILKLQSCAPELRQPSSPQRSSGCRLHRSCQFARTTSETPVFPFEASRGQPCFLRVRTPRGWFSSDPVLRKDALVTFLSLCMRKCIWKVSISSVTCFARPEHFLNSFSEVGLPSERPVMQSSMRRRLAAGVDDSGVVASAPGSMQEALSIQSSNSPISNETGVVWDQTPPTTRKTAAVQQDKDHGVKCKFHDKALHGFTHASTPCKFTLQVHHASSPCKLTLQVHHASAA